MDEFAHQLLSLIEIPILLVQGDRVGFANAAAQTLLGGHIEGQDIRIALRDPEALKLIKTPEGGRAKITGLSVRGSVWQMVCNPLSGNNRLISLQDNSVQVSVARAHADFVANASHELRTPLTAILGYVETLSDPKAGEDAATRQRFLDIIKREATRMQSLVSDLMSLSRIEAVRHEAPSDNIEMVSLCREIIGERPRDVEVHFNTNAEQAFVTGDSAQLAQIVRNLVDNAEKYGGSERGTTVQLEASERGWLTLSITDHGEGIAPEHLPRLTERFYRADTGRSRAAGGTGLGLAIVKHIVERHRGRLDISSRQGEGTTAMIMLPQDKSD